ncbi:hypothetical protein MKX03_025386 [Papaver bracteatum]|nr:hypothetical protein MKX03_025386 [Papaver bracteatum]
MESSSIVSSEKGLRKGAWAEEEDQLLRKCILKYGEGKWRQVPLRAGLNRCRKSCRLRWLNYLQPNIKRGEFKEDEVDLIIRMHKLLANDIKNYYNTHLKKTCSSRYNTEKGKQVVVTKKSADHDNTAHHDTQDHEHRKILKRRRLCTNISTIDHIDDKHMRTQVLRPQPRTFKKSPWNINNVPTPNNKHIITTTTRFPKDSQVVSENATKCLPLLFDDHHEHFSSDQQIYDNSTSWLKNYLFGETEEETTTKKKKTKLKKKKRVTSNNNASSKFESNTTKGIEEGMAKDKNGGSDNQHAYNYRSFNDGKGLEEGGNAGDNDNFWNNYLDDNLWHMLVEEQEEYLMI